MSGLNVFDFLWSSEVSASEAKHAGRVPVTGDGVASVAMQSLLSACKWKNFCCFVSRHRHTPIARCIVCLGYFYLKGEVAWAMDNEKERALGLGTAVTAPLEEGGLAIWVVLGVLLFCLFGLAYASPKSRKAVIFPVVGCLLFMVDLLIGNPWYISLVKFFAWSCSHYIFVRSTDFLRDQVPYKLWFDMLAYRQETAWIKGLPSTATYVWVYILACVAQGFSNEWPLLGAVSVGLFLVLSVWFFLSAVNIVVTPVVPDRILIRHGVPVRFFPFIKGGEKLMQLCGKAVGGVWTALLGTELAVNTSPVEVAGPLTNAATNKFITKQPLWMPHTKAETKVLWAKYVADLNKAYPPK